MNLQTVEMQISETRQAIQLQIKEHEEKMMELHKQMVKSERQKALLLSNIDVERIEKAQQIMQIRIAGDYFDRSCIFDAIDDINADTPHMKEQYFGSKNYAHWVNQRSDHKYFYGPAHGTIVFSVGLMQAFRKGLTNEQKEDCLYYLNLLLQKGRQLLAS